MTWLFASGGQSIGDFSFSISSSIEYSGLISFRVEWFDLLAVQGTLKSLLQHHNSKASISSILPWEMPWTEERGRLSPWGREESDATERFHFHFSLSCIGEGNGNPLQYSRLKNTMKRGKWQATVHGVTKVGHDLATKPPPPP